MAKKKAMIGIISVLCGIIIIGISAFLLSSSISPFGRTTQPKVVRQPPYTVHRSQEVPLSTHRALSDVESEEATALLPWGMAVDSARGFMWVAEPGCEPKPKCPATTAGILGQYAFSDSSLIQNFNEPSGYSSPLFVAVDKDGNVWFTDSLSQRVGYLVPSTGQIVVRNVPANSHPHDGLILDKNGRVWFTEQDALTLNMWPMSSVK